MQDLLRSIWSALGVPPPWALVLTLIILVAAFLVQLLINRAMNRELEELKSKLQGTIEDKKAELQKTIEDKKFVQSQDLEKLQAELQAEIARQTEELKAELQKTTEEQKFVLSLYASIATYTQEQYHGLMRAYIDLFEGEGKTATGEAFAKIASKADNDVMRPFRKYQTLLDKQTMNKIY